MLTPLTPEVISRQATINIGTIGHVAHGKSTVVKAISGVQVRCTQTDSPLTDTDVVALNPVLKTADTCAEMSYFATHASCVASGRQPETCISPELPPIVAMTVVIPPQTHFPT